MKASVVTLFLSLAFSFVAKAESFSYVCEPSMSNPDRVPYILQVEGESIRVGQSLETLKAGEKTKNNHYGYLVNYLAYKGELESWYPERFVRLYIKPELLAGGAALSDGGMGGWMVLFVNGSGYYRLENMYMCRR